MGRHLPTNRLTHASPAHQVSDPVTHVTWIDLRRQPFVAVSSSPIDGRMRPFPCGGPIKHLPSGGIPREWLREIYDGDLCASWELVSLTAACYSFWIGQMNRRPDQERRPTIGNCPIIDRSQVMISQRAASRWRHRRQSCHPPARIVPAISGQILICSLFVRGRAGRADCNATAGPVAPPLRRSPARRGRSAYRLVSSVDHAPATVSSGDRRRRHSPVRRDSGIEARQPQSRSGARALGRRLAVVEQVCDSAEKKLKSRG
jgi:hypothetical protein